MTMRFMESREVVGGDGVSEVRQMAMVAEGTC